MIALTDQEIFWSFYPFLYASDRSSCRVEDESEIVPPSGFFADEEVSPLWMIEIKTAKQLQSLLSLKEDIVVLCPPKLYWDTVKERKQGIHCLDERMMKNALTTLLNKTPSTKNLTPFLTGFQGESFQKILPLLQTIFMMRAQDPQLVVDEAFLCSLMSEEDAMIMGYKPASKRKAPLHKEDYGMLVFEMEKTIRGLRYTKAFSESIKTIYDLNCAKILLKKGKSPLAFRHWLEDQTP
jgi:hypothetical protein